MNPHYVSNANFKFDGTVSSVRQKYESLRRNHSGIWREIARQIASLPGVKMADACWGSHDIFAVIEVKESQELNKLVMDKIQRLEGVGNTNTHIAID